jgi:hypothetical protein
VCWEGGGPIVSNTGELTDDTPMACLANSLLTCGKPNQLKNPFSRPSRETRRKSSRLISLLRQHIYAGDAVFTNMETGTMELTARNCESGPTYCWPMAARPKPMAAVHAEDEAFVDYSVNFGDRAPAGHANMVIMLQGERLVLVASAGQWGPRSRPGSHSLSVTNFAAKPGALAAA